MKEKIISILKRFTSPVVLLGMASIVIAVSGISPETMTSWSILWENIKNIFTNPFVLITIIIQIFAFLNNPTEKNKF